MKKYFKMIGYILLYSLIYLAFQIFTAIVILVIDIIRYRNTKTLTQITEMLYAQSYIVIFTAAVISLFLYYLLLKDNEKNLWKRCGFKKVSLKNTALIALAALSLSFITCAFVYATQNIFKDYSSISENMVKEMESIPGILAAVIIAPIFEEILFRGLIFNELRKNVNVVVSIILQALIFGLFHGNLAQGIYAALLGSVAAIIYVWTKSIVSNMLLHIFFNICGSLVVPQIVDKTTNLIYIYCAAAVIVLALALFQMYKNTHYKVQIGSGYDISK